MDQIQNLTKSEKINLGTKEIAKRIREQLKDIKNCKFSVTIDRYSGGSSISISLMETNFKVIKDFKEIDELVLLASEQRGYKREQIKEIQESKGEHQLNQYTLKEDFKKDLWCNGVFLTERGHNLLSDVISIANFYNYDDGDSMIDYYDVNFYLQINIGRWDKDYILKEEAIK